MKKRLLSWVVIAMFSVMTAVMCSACSLDGLFGGSAETYTVTYYVDGEVWKTVTATDGELIILPKYESDTEIFNGWKLNGQGDAIKGIYTVNGNTIFIADFKESVKLTFYVNNEVWKVDYTEPGQLFFLPVVADAVSYKFNGWKINGQGETLNNSCIVEEATVFVADITDTGKRLLTYIVDGSAWNAVEVNKDTNVALDTVTETNGRIFKGWKVNGEGTTYSNYALQEDTVLVAHFTCQVNFNNDGNITSREVDEGTQITLDKLDGNNKTFDGWKIDGEGSLLNGQYTVTKNTNFVAHYICTVTYNNNINGKITTRKFDAGTEITLETLPNTDTQGFIGWQIDGAGELLTGNYIVNSHTYFVANFADLDWVAYNGFDLAFYGYELWNHSNDFKKYTLGYKYYFVATNNSGAYFGTTATFSYPDGYEGNFNGGCVWKSASGNTYYTDGIYNWKLNQDNVMQWVTFEWKQAPTDTPLSGNKIWNDGDNTYFSNGIYHYVLDEANLTWTKKVWNVDYFDGFNVWTDGSQIYLSQGTAQYVLKDGTWVKKGWGNNLTDFNGINVWTDGVNYYYSHNEKQYILDSNGIWVKKEWVGFVPKRGNYIWCDQYDRYYYSEGEIQYKLIS